MFLCQWGSLHWVNVFILNRITLCVWYCVNWTEKNNNHFPVYRVMRLTSEGAIIPVGKMCPWEDPDTNVCSVWVNMWLRLEPELLFIWVGLQGEERQTGGMYGGWAEPSHVTLEFGSLWNLCHMDKAQQNDTKCLALTGGKRSVGVNPERCVQRAALFISTNT